MEVVLSSPVGAIAAWVVLCRCFHLGIIHSAVVNGWHDRLVHILCTTPLISWKSEHPSTVAVLYFSKYVSDIYRLKQLLVNGYKLLFSAISCALFFSLYQICVTKWPICTLLLKILAHLQVWRGRRGRVQSSRSCYCFMNPQLQR